MQKEGRPGPVFVEVPFNIQKGEINEEEQVVYIKEDQKHDITNKRVKEIAREIRDAKNPIIIAGGGVKLSRTSNELNTLIRENNISVVTTWPAHGVIDESESNYFGPIGRSGSQEAMKKVIEADLVIGLGCRFNPKVVNEETLGVGQKVIAIDIDKHELSQGLYNFDSKVNADLKIILPMINKELSKERKVKNGDDSFPRRMRSKETRDKIDPVEFFEILSERLGEDIIYTLDTGCNLTWAMQGLKPKRRNEYISAFGHSPMGFALAAGIGAAEIQDKKRVISICGDGGLLLNSQDLHTIGIMELNIKVIVINNNCLANTHPQ